MSRQSTKFESNLRTCLLCLAAGLILSSCGQKGAARTGGAPTAVPDIFYVTGSRNPSQTMDLYLPPSLGSRKLPVIVWIHGGAWVGGDKRQVSIAEFLKRGYAVASINYRLAKEAPFPAQIHDCKAAVRWLRSKANTYDLDPGRIGVFGFSAGGHLASLMGTSNGEKSVEGDIGVTDQPSHVQAVCDWCGVVDLSAVKMKAYQAPDSACRLLLGGDPVTKKDLARMASAVSFASKGDPPFLIMHGDRDATVPIAQSRRLYEVLKRAGVPAVFRVVEGGAHDFSSPATLNVVADFFDENLKPDHAR